MPNDKARGSLGRRALLARTVAIAAFAAWPWQSVAAKEAPVSDIVLIPGAWHGAWCWNMVKTALEAQGFRVHAFTLPGLAERADELTPQLGLQDHIDDTIAQIEGKGLTRFVLVGHSYGGMVITGVADALKSKIAHIVYLAAALPKGGETMLSYGEPRPAEVVQASVAAMKGLAPDGVGMAAFPPSVLGIPEDHARYEWVAEKLTPRPLKTWLDPIALPNGGADGLPATYVLCTDPALAMTQFAWIAEQQKGQPDWDVVELATGHDAMVTEPDKVAAIIAAAANRKKESL